MALSWADRFAPWVGLALVTLAAARVVDPVLVIEPSTPAGGDLPGHVYMAEIMSKRFFPWSATGWDEGWMGGFPMFRSYFPLSFYVIALMDTAFRFDLAFKLVFVASFVLLPVSIYI